MMRNVLGLLWVVCSLALLPVQAQAANVGESVFALWAADNVFFVGTVVEKVPGGCLVVFEDGDTAVVAEANIRPLDLRLGAPVIAKWSDGKYYPGTIGKIVGRCLFIHYNDGDKGWAPLSWIVVK